MWHKQTNKQSLFPTVVKQITTKIFFQIGHQTSLVLFLFKYLAALLLPHKLHNTEWEADWWIGLLW